MNSTRFVFFFFQAEDGIRDVAVTGVQTCALPIYEEAKDSGHGAQGVHVIVVKADAKIGVGQIRIESLGAQKMIASADAKAGGVAVFSAQGIEARGRGIRHARVELHLRGFLLLELGGSKRGGGGRQFEVMLVGWKD